MSSRISGMVKVRKEKTSDSEMAPGRILETTDSVTGVLRVSLSSYHLLQRQCRIRVDVDLRDGGE